MAETKSETMLRLGGLTKVTGGAAVHGVCLIGAGHAVHASLAVFKQRLIPNIRMTSLIEGEMTGFREGMAAHGGFMTAAFADHLPIPTKRINVYEKNIVMCDTIEDAVKGVDTILLLLPSFAYEDCFRALKPYLKPGAFTIIDTSLL